MRRSRTRQCPNSWSIFGLAGASARALEFTILTAARTGEAIGARWSEIDLDKGLWTVPGERMKSGRERRVPLSDRALAIISQLPDGEFLFAGRKPHKPLSQQAMLELSRCAARAQPFTASARRSAIGRLTNILRRSCEIAALVHARSNESGAENRYDGEAAAGDRRLGRQLRARTGRRQQRVVRIQSPGVMARPTLRRENT